MSLKAKKYWQNYDKIPKNYHVEKIEIHVIKFYTDKFFFYQRTKNQKKCILKETTNTDVHFNIKIHTCKYKNIDNITCINHVIK